MDYIQDFSNRISFLAYKTVSLYTCEQGGVILHSNCLRFSKTGTMLPIMCIFMSPIPKFANFGARLRGAHAKLYNNIQKITGASKIKKISDNLQFSSFYLKEQSTNRNFGIGVL